MKDQSKTCAQEISLGTPSPTFSLVSGDGPTPFDSLVGQTIDPFGPGAALANLSARQAKEGGLLTSGIYGPPGSTWSERADRNESLVNKLQALCTGSTLYRETWKKKSTPWGLRYWAHTASAPRTSGSGSTGWPTPCSRDEKDCTPSSKFLAARRRHSPSIATRLLSRGEHFSVVPRVYAATMGYPAAWVSCGVLAMQSLRRSPRSSSKRA
jgi:hypothetical protein